MLDRIADAAVSSLVQEALTTPKPGLVDMKSNGSHTDMTLNTFLVSAGSLSPYFHDVAHIAGTHRGSLPQLFTAVRRRGIQAEQEMFAATGGINTHKGAIFSGGILTAAASYVWSRTGTLETDAVFSCAQRMVRRTLEAEFRRIADAPQSHGEKLFVQYGVRGIRGQAMEGFPAVRDIALPAFTALMRQGCDLNASRIQALLLLMESVDDTNVLHRGGQKALAYIKAQAHRILDMGGAFTSGGMQALYRLDRACIQRNLSSGGCADLLAVTIFMHTVKTIQEELAKEQPLTLALLRRNMPAVSRRTQALSK